MVESRTGKPHLKRFWSRAALAFALYEIVILLLLLVLLAATSNTTIPSRFWSRAALAFALYAELDQGGGQEGGWHSLLLLNQLPFMLFNGRACWTLGIWVIIHDVCSTPTKIKINTNYLKLTGTSFDNWFDGWAGWRSFSICVVGLVDFKWKSGQKSNIAILSQTRMMKITVSHDIQ